MWGRTTDYNKGTINITIKVLQANVYTLLNIPGELVSSIKFNKLFRTTATYLADPENISEINDYIFGGSCCSADIHLEG